MMAERADSTMRGSVELDVAADRMANQVDSFVLTVTELLCALGNESRFAAMPENRERISLILERLETLDGMMGGLRMRLREQHRHANGDRPAQEPQDGEASTGGKTG